MLKPSLAVFIFLLTINLIYDKNKFFIEERKTRKLIQVGLVIEQHNKKENYNFKPVGLEADLIRKFAKLNDYRIQFNKYSNQQKLLTALEKKEIDIAYNKISNNKKISTKYITSPPIYKIKEHLVYNSKKNNKPNNIAEIISEITIYKKIEHIETIKEQGIKDIKGIKYSNKSIREIIKGIEKNEIKYTILNSLDLNEQRIKHPHIKSAFSLKEKDIVMLLNKETDLEFVEKILESWDVLRENNTFEQLYDKHYSASENFDQYETRKLIEKIETTLPKYRKHFEKYSELIEGLDWIHLAAISYQESLWNPKAVSYTGVKGLMMLTLPTAKEMNVNNRLDPIQSIKGGAMYLAHLIKQAPDTMEENEKLWFAIASYNIGIGHIRDARDILLQRGMNPNLWVNLRKTLPLLEKRSFFKYTKHGYARGNETIEYIKKIRKHYKIIKNYYLN